MGRKRALFVLGVIFFLNILVWSVVGGSARFLEVTFFDVGQGDAIFVETSQGHQILIDGGPGSAILEKIGAEMPLWDRTIDLIILSHPEHDHMNGLLEVLKRYQVENILWTGILRETSEFREWQRLIGQEGARIKIAEAGQMISLGRKENGGYIKILHPFESLVEQEPKNSNNTSIVAKLVFGDNSFLFTGDIYKSVEVELMERNSEIDSDILKVSHHGSKTSTAPEFVEKVSPQVAVIQVGANNSYGHPHPETLETLANYGINVLRNDLRGDIKIISNGKSYLSYFQN